MSKHCGFKQVCSNWLVEFDSTKEAGRVNGSGAQLAVLQLDSANCLSKAQQNIIFLQNFL